MLQLGAFHTLEVMEERSAGLVLGEDRILLPRSQVPEGCKVGDTLEVFVFEDTEGRPVATAKPPKARIGQFGYLRVVDRMPAGVFVDWGLDKDLFVPEREQVNPMIVGRRYVIAVTKDDLGRAMGSNLIREFLDDQCEGLQVGQRVSAMVYEMHERGMKVIVDGRYEGMIFHDEIYQRLHLGDIVEGSIAAIRPDAKLDVRLRERGMAAMSEGQQQLHDALVRAGGFLALHDKSDPAEIKAQLAMSKKAFKRASGNLLRAGVLRMEDGGLRLVATQAAPDADEPAN